MTAEHEVRARHILVETEDEARRSLADAEEGRGLRRARQGEVEGPRLGRTAAISATSPRTRWCRNSPKPRSSSTRAQLSDPVKTQFGWHVIKVEDKRTKPVAGIRARSRTRSRPSWCARRRPSWSPSCAPSAKIERLDQPAARRRRRLPATPAPAPKQASHQDRHAGLDARRPAPVMHRRSAVDAPGIRRRA